MKKTFLGLGLLGCLCLHGYAQNDTLKSFPLSDVRLLDGPFKKAQETDLKYMLALNPDKLLAPFLREAGIATKATTYPNWEGTGLDGHIGGHYLSALSNMVASTGNAEAGRRLQYMIGWLDRCQQASGDGYVGGVPGGKAMWAELAKGRIKAESFALNDKWVPWYNLHKLFAGLCDAYLLTGNQEAKKILVKLSDWALNITSGLSDEQFQLMLRCEQGGMNEALADVSDITGNSKYLALARRFSHRAILNPLMQDKDSLTGLHANTQIPKVIGYMRIAELSPNKDWAEAARFFWQTVVENRTISIGGNSVREHFNPINNFSSMLESNQGPETCNTYNMLKLTKHLFLSAPSGRYMDYYEKALYNHILSSQHPSGGFVYFTPIRPQHYRVYSQPDQDFWCCVGSGMENHGKYGELIYAHDAGDLYVNLFIPSVLRWKEKGLVLTQQNSFPASEATGMTLQLQKPMTFSLLIRNPSWVVPGKMTVSVNNKAVEVEAGPLGYVKVRRKWNSGDKITVVLPMQTRAEYLPDHSAWVSFSHGPVELAAATDTASQTGLRADASRMSHVANGPMYALDEAPLLVSDKEDVASSLQPVKGQPLTYTISSLIYQDKYKSLRLVPFYQLYDTRYMLYWPVTRPEDLKKKQALMVQEEKDRQALEARTIDQVAAGEQQPESDHGFRSEQSESGLVIDQHWRQATKWFSYDLRNAGRAARTLRISYYGGDQPVSFDILVNNELLSSVEHDAAHKDSFYDVEYPLPDAVTTSQKGEVMTVRFVAHDGSATGRIHAVRLMK